MSLLSGVYGRATRLRRAWYRRHPDRVRRLSQPVVSVGNLVVGGSGKTPIVASLARLLAAAGERPAILSRGYGRRHGSREALVVSDGRSLLATPEASGDEPYMLARAGLGVPVLVAADRYRAGQLAERQFGATVHLLDDGFQHLRLARAVNLLAVARRDLDEQVLPSGRLREPLDAATSADALLVAGTDEDGEAIGRRLGVELVFRVALLFGTAALLDPLGAALPAAAARRVVAVAGIARPERLFAALRAEGWEVVRELVFRDHHWFSAGDLASIERTAREAGVGIVMTTEKDAARLAALPAARRLTWAYLPMRAEIEPAGPFGAWITERLAAARRRGVAAA